MHVVVARGAVDGHLAAAIYEIVGQPRIRNELDWIKEIREASGDIDPRLTLRAGAAIRAVFGK